MPEALTYDTSYCTRLKGGGIVLSLQFRDITLLSIKLDNSLARFVRNSY